MAKASDALRERVNPKWNPDVTKTISASLAAVDLAYEARKPNPQPATTQRERDQDKATVLAHLAKHVGPMVRKSEIEVARHKDRLFEDRVALREKAMQHDSPRDAQLAVEMRAHLKSLSPADRLKMLYGPQADKLAQRSALEAHPALIGGMDAEALHRVQDDFLTKHFPTAVAALADREAAVEHAAASLAMAKNTLAKTADLPPVDFAEFYETIKPA